MDLITLVLVLALWGFLVYLVTTFIPMPQIFKVAIQVIAVVAVILFLIQRLGGSLPNVLR